MYRLFLIALLGAFLLWRLDDLAEGMSSALDILVFLVWISLLLAPLFIEINLFGLKFRQIIEESTNEVKREIASARNELASAIAVQNTVSQHVNVSLPVGSVPADAQTITSVTPSATRRSAMEYKILNTLWTKQVNKYPDVPTRFTFRLFVHLPEFSEWRTAATKLLAEGMVGETNEGQVYLTDRGFEYCKQHYTEFPNDQWWPEEPMDMVNLKKILG